MRAYAAIATSAEVAQNIEEWAGTLDLPVQRYELPWVMARRSTAYMARSMDRLYGEGGRDNRPHLKDVNPRGSAHIPWPHTWEEYHFQMRLAGFMAAAASLPRLKRLLTAGSYSRSGWTYYGICPAMAMQMCRSPHRWERWVGKVMRRARMILSAWEMHPSYRILTMLLLRPEGGLPRVGKMAIRLAAACLRERFWPVSGDGATITRPVDVLMACRLYRQAAIPGDPAETPREETPRESLAEFGAHRLSIWNPRVICMARDGAVIADSVMRGDRLVVGKRTVCQVVVQCPTTGLQHRITVPAWFALPLREGESAARRVRAAVAWTFGLTPDAYRPGKES